MPHLLALAMAVTMAASPILAAQRPAPPAPPLPLPAFVPVPLTPEAEALQRRLERRRQALAGSEVGAALERFYAARGYAPAWFAAGEALPPVGAYLGALCAAEAEGLVPERYGRSRLEQRLARVHTGVERPGLWLEVELELSVSFLTYASHLLSGQVAPRTQGWRTRPRRADLAGVLEQALRGGDVAAALAALAPPHEGYRRLKEALAVYRAIASAGGWPLVPPGPMLARGATHPRVAVLRARLRATGELQAPAGAPGVEAHFDAPLEEAVKAFQVRHGLVASGRVEAQTLAALRVPVEARIRQLRVNLERWRWLPAGDRLHGRAVSRWDRVHHRRPAPAERHQLP
jgi:murein L,D-transpeptidase YcbB/YkuD